jgi:alpha-amylase
MSKKTINFAFCIHNHQPVGNFEKVLDDAYNNAYHPWLDCLRRNPHMKLGLHNSGPLWDYFLDCKPEYIKKLRDLAKSGQVEILSGGYYEPILINISDRDKIAQIKKMNKVIQRETSQKPKGMWCAERVWEPHLAKPLFNSDMYYTVLDEYHFRAAGMEEKDTFGYYVTEEQGFHLCVFPINFYLRQSIPYHQPEEIIEYLKKNATEEGDRIAVFADDGEKFGVWPNSYKITWEEKWLDRFFNLVEKNSDVIKSVNFSEFMEKYPPAGRTYLPTASYFEMSTWAMPTSTGKKFGDIVEKYQKENIWDEYRYFVRGGFWRNFLVKYPESNRIQKKALFISEKIQKMVTGAKEEALNELYMGQCNCAYWHGVFGGIYLPHLRHAVQEHLISAEDLADDEFHKGEPFKESMKIDINKDLRDEVIINTLKFNTQFIPHEGGAMYELDYKPKAINYCDTLTRREEIYHRNVTKLKDEKAGKLSDDAYIGDMGAAKEKGLKDLLKYDRYERRSFLDHFLGDNVTLGSFRDCAYDEKGAFLKKPYDIFISAKDDKAILTLTAEGKVSTGRDECPVQIEKTFFVPEGGSAIQIQYWIINNGSDPVRLRYGCEMDFSCLSKDPATNFLYIERVIKEKVKDKETERIETETFPLDSDGELTGIPGLTIQDGHREMKLHFSSEDVPEAIWHFPIETVSMSEEGFEKVYQSTVIMPIWTLELEPGDAWENNMELVFEEMEPAEEAE